MQAGQIINKRILQQSTSTSGHFEAPPDLVWSSENDHQLLELNLKIYRSLLFWSQSYTRWYRKQAIASAISREPRFNSWGIVVIAGVPNGRFTLLGSKFKAVSANHQYQGIFLVQSQLPWWYLGNEICISLARGKLPGDSGLSQPQEHCMNLTLPTLQINFSTVLGFSFTFLDFRYHALDFAFILLNIFRLFKHLLFLFLNLIFFVEVWLRCL